MKAWPCPTVYDVCLRVPLLHPYERRNRCESPPTTLIRTVPDAYVSALQVWSGVALVIGPPFGGLAHPLGGVSFMFISMAVFPLAMLACVPRIRHLLQSAKVSRWEVTRHVERSNTGGGWGLLTLEVDFVRSTYRTLISNTNSVLKRGY